MKENERSHRQEREHEKAEHSHSTPPTFLRSLHPAWYVVLAVILCGASVLIWTFVVW